MIYKINASDVAALIGKNPYKLKEEIFERIAIDAGLVDFEESDIPEEVANQLQEQVQHVLQSKTAQQTEYCMQQYEEKACELVIEDIIMRNTGKTPILSKSVEVTSAVQNAIKNICKEEHRPKIIIEKAMKNSEVQKFIKTNSEVQEVCKKINTIRGSALEETSTNLFEKTYKAPILHRNSKCYIWKSDKYLIAGRVDGLTDDAIIETKTRRRVWKTIPEYDVIQLRCYMKLCNKQIGYLNEQFPDGTSRSTKIEWNDSEWNDIQVAISCAIIEFESLYSK